MKFKHIEGLSDKEDLKDWADYAKDNSYKPKDAAIPKPPHLKEGKTWADPIAAAKSMGVGYSNTYKESKIIPTLESTPGKNDGLPGGPNRP